MPPSRRTPASLELALINPQTARVLLPAASHLLNETLGVLAARVDLEGVTQREIGR